MSGERFSRQSFLGENSEVAIANCIIGLAGLGGGGSHVVQQLAHIGFQQYVIFDDDIVEESNLNRLVGATSVDALAGTPKVQLAKQMIFGLQPEAKVDAHPCRWQEHPELLHRCHIVIGCVDSYKGREELENECRRHLIHYIDIGMDVHGTTPPVIGGQIILSSPGGHCMKCMRFLTDAKLAEEGRRYGEAGHRPQVVWPNGVLASTAVGLAVNLVCNWTAKTHSCAYLIYDGNEFTIKPSLLLRSLEGTPCPHFKEADLGPPVLIEL